MWLLHGKVETTFAQCFSYDLPPECLDLADPSLPICDYKVPIVGYGNRDMDWTDVGQDLYDAQLKELNEEYPIEGPSIFHCSNGDVGNGEFPEDRKAFDDRVNNQLSGYQGIMCAGAAMLWPIF
jgi:hypothetical protein